MVVVLSMAVVPVQRWGCQGLRRETPAGQGSTPSWSGTLADCVAAEKNTTVTSSWEYEYSEDGNIFWFKEYEYTHATTVAQQHSNRLNSGATPDQTWVPLNGQN